MFARFVFYRKSTLTAKSDHWIVQVFWCLSLITLFLPGLHASLIGNPIPDNNPMKGSPESQQILAYSFTLPGTFKVKHGGVIFRSRSFLSLSALSRVPHLPEPWVICMTAITLPSSVAWSTWSPCKLVDTQQVGLDIIPVQTDGTNSFLPQLSLPSLPRFIRWLLNSLCTLLLNSVANFGKCVNKINSFSEGHDNH